MLFLLFDEFAHSGCQINRVDAQELLQLLVNCRLGRVGLTRNEILFIAQVFALLLKLVGLLVPKLVQALVRDVLVLAALIVVTLDLLNGDVFLLQNLSVCVAINVIVLKLLALHDELLLQVDFLALVLSLSEELLEEGLLALELGRLFTV